ncbi:MAG: CoA transferase [Myxococcales bacterium]|nr:CoA transferase [Myxococcales bacterium]
MQERPNEGAPLSGIRVLDFTRYLAGPFCTMLLSDYGADVVRVESPKGRELRVPGSDRDSYFFLSANRGKRSLAVDLKRARGRELIERLAPAYDVVVENFRPGVMDKLGLGASTLMASNPRLVFCSISGFGSDGPYRDRPGFDQIAQGMGGFMSLTGTKEQGPTRAGIAICDLLAGMFAVQGIQLALFSRERTGRGQVVDASLLESILGVLTWGAGMYFEGGKAPGPAGHHHPLASPYGRFRARDGYLNIAAGNDAMWTKLAHALGRPQWPQDPRFDSAGARLRNRDALSEAIEQVLSTQGVEHWVQLLNEAGVPTGPVLNMEQVFNDPQVLAREMLVEMPHPVVGTFKTTGLPIKLSETPGRIQRRPPLLGEHTEEVLQEHGVSATELAELRAEAVVSG